MHDIHTAEEEEDKVLASHHIINLHIFSVTSRHWALDGSNSKLLILGQASESSACVASPIGCMEWGFICCCRDKAAPQLWMQPGWHLLLDAFLHHCRKVFQHKDLGAVQCLETALQQQITSRVGAS